VAAACLGAALGAPGCGSSWSGRPLEEVAAAAGKGERGALRELVARFGNADPAQAQQAWEAAVNLGAPAVPELIRGLDTGNRAVGEHAAGALGALAAKEGVDPLIAALGRKDFRRYAAAWALGEIGDPRAIPPLVRALGDEDGETRKFATRAVIKFGPAAVDALLAALGDPSPNVRHYAARALGQLQAKQAVEPLLKLEGKVDPEPLFWALGRIGDPRALPLLERAAGDADWRARLTAVQALGDLANPAAVPQLRRSLEDAEWIVREWAARGLESVTGERVTYRDQQGRQVVPYSLYR
jgi:HEAT repeat protein